jgi:hypothetical protein
MRQPLLGTSISAAQEPAGQAQKKARLLPTGPWKFWERMPERHPLCAANREMLQVRNVHFKLQNLQFSHIYLN